MFDPPNVSSGPGRSTEGAIVSTESLP